MTYSGCDPSFKVMERNPEIRQMLNNPEVLRQVTVLKALSVQTFSSFNTSDDGDRTEPVKVAGDDKNDGSTDAEPWVYARRPGDIDKHDQNYIWVFDQVGGRAFTLQFQFRQFYNGCTETSKNLFSMPWEGPTLFRCHLAFRNSGILFSTFSTSQDLRGQTAAPAPTPSTETTAPAPNPWAPQGSQAPPATSGTSATPQGPGLGAALGQGGGMFTSPGMQSLMGQMRWVLSFYGKE